MCNDDATALECLAQWIALVRTGRFDDSARLQQEHLARLADAERTTTMVTLPPSSAPCPDCGLRPCQLGHDVRFSGPRCFFCRRGHRLCRGSDFYRQMHNVSLLVTTGETHHLHHDFADPSCLHKASDLSVSRRNASRSHTVFTLTPHEFMRLGRRPCAYCHRPATPVVPNGIDRLDNDAGYTTANAVPCCSFCNMLKGAMHPVDYLLKAMAVASHTPSHTRRK